MSGGHSKSLIAFLKANAATVYRPIWVSKFEMIAAISGDDNY